MRLSCGMSLFFFFFQKRFGIIKQLLSLSEGDMTICSPSTGYIALGLRPRAILPASGEQIVMSPSLKGNNYIILYYIILYYIILYYIILYYIILYYIIEGFTNWSWHGKDIF